MTSTLFKPWIGTWLRLMALCTVVLPSPPARSQPMLLQPPLGIEAQEGAGGVVRLRQQRFDGVTGNGGDRARQVQSTPAEAAVVVPYVAGEFERYVQSQTGVGSTLRRLGAELVIEPPDTQANDLSPLVPDDYLIGPGDEILVTLWGSVEADLRLTVDRGGRIAIPRVGAVQVSGVRYGDLPDLVNRRISQTFRNFQSGFSIGQLRGIRVFVTGFVNRPGAYTMSSLSSIVAAVIRAGGPSVSGSFRVIELRRGSTVVTRLDLYDLLTKGDRSTDRVLQGGDVVHIGPVGSQVGVIGSVNRAAIVELAANETISDALRYAGGFSAVADRSRLAIERLRDRNSGRVAQVELPAALSEPLSNGDVLRIFSVVEAQLPTEGQAKRVHVEGEVARPGEYVLPQASSLRDAVRAAGGLTTAAYLYAAEFTRESVRLRQQENYDRAVRDLETDLSRNTSTRRVATAEEATTRQANNQEAGKLVDRLKSLKPTGRVVLQLKIDTKELPDLALEDGDRLLIPPTPTTIGVFGSVFNAATYLHTAGRTLGDYIALAGGPTKGADRRSIFVVRANGQVISSPQRETGWFTSSSALSGMRAEPGDTIFVPEELDKTTTLQAVKDWTQILFQFGVGAAGIRSAFQ